jgi:glycyl-tRNA synthetase beta chain
MRLLIEIGTEELPAGVINIALESLKEGIEKLLGVKVIKTYGTPRRLALLTEDFENTPTEKEEVIVGPPVSIAYEDGKPTKALLGFLQKVSATQEEVIEVQKGEGRYVAVRRVQREKTPLEKLKEEFEGLLQSIPFSQKDALEFGGLNLFKTYPMVVRPLRREGCPTPIW